MTSNPERGFALVITMMALLMMTALGAALALTTAAEARLAANYRMAAEGLYAAEAALGRASTDLAGLDSWSAVVGGLVQSPFVDGSPGGMRALADGTVIDLSVVVNLANCGQLTVCSVSEMNAVTIDRPSGVNNPRWQLFAYGPMAALVPTGTVDSDFYVVVLVGDDGRETDDDPLVDGGPPVAPHTENPGRGAVEVRALAFGPAGARQTVQSTVARAVRSLSWREIR